MDIIDAITISYKKYTAPYGIDCENKHPEFWIQCLKTGIAEIESDLSRQNLAKEFADIAFIAIDGLTKMGFDTRKVLENRLEVNSKKDLGNRNINFYIQKEKELRNKLQ